MNNFFTRALTGAAFVTILIGSILFGANTFIALFLIITIIGVWEFYTLAEKGQNHPQKITGTLLSITLFLSNASVCIGYFDERILIINIPILFSIFIIELYLKDTNPFRNIAFTILGVIYVALPFSLLNYIVFEGTFFDSEILLGFFLILWANDTGAYLAGLTMGKRKLFERISPKKTWEGSIGGAVFSFIVAFVVSKYLSDLRLIDWMVIAFILVVIGTLGDLVESLYKRSKNVKDSGNILPGHGGILDRFDSLLLSTPFVFSYLMLVRFS